jgi:two-component system sensor histidine kinase PhoQ
MTRLIEFQLQRAAAAGRAPLATPVAVPPVVEEIVKALRKVYAEKGVQTQLDLDPAATFTGDRDDLTEVLGNLLDNAYKWCRSRVQVGARILPATNGAAPRLEIWIDDDGPGIPLAQRRAVTRRGTRTDASVPGHGLGLAMVQETVRLYQGECRLDTGPLGGLRVALELPLTHA